MSDPTPQDMRDLLIRIDVKVGHIDEKLNAMDRRAEGQEGRIKALEMEMADRATLKTRFFAAETDIASHEKRLAQIETTARNGATLGEWAWRFFGPTVTAAIVFIATLYFNAPQP